MKQDTELTTDVFVNGDGCAYSADRTVLLRAPEGIESCAVLPGCERIAPNAFKACARLTSVELPDSLREVGDFAFSFTALEQFACPPHLRSIGSKAFYSCEHLGRFAFNDELESLGDEAFDSSGLRELHLPASLRSMGHRILRHSRLSEHFAPGLITIDGRNERYAIDAQGGLYARGKTGLVLLELMAANVGEHRALPGTVRISSGAYRLNRTIRRVSLPEGVREIGNGAFRMCTALERVDTPESLESIGADAFYSSSLRSLYLSRNFKSLGPCSLMTADPDTGLPTLREVTVSPDNRRFYTQDGFLLERRAKGDFLACYFGDGKVARVPGSVRKLGPYSLTGCANVQVLVIHDRIEHIHSTAFMLSRPIEFVRVLLSEPVEGHDHIDLCFPRSSARNTLFSRAFFRPLSKWMRAMDADAAAVGLFNMGSTMRHLSHVMRKHAGSMRTNTVPSPGVVAPARDLSGRSAYAIDEYEGQLDVERLCSYSDHAIVGLYHEPYALAVCALRRLEDPIYLSEAHREAMLEQIERQFPEILASCARRGDTATAEKLVDLGLINPGNIEECIAAARSVADIALSSFLLQIKRERFGQATFDFGI